MARLISTLLLVAACLLAAPAHAQHTEPEPGPILGPAPCNSDTPWGCYRHHQWLPLIQTH